MSQKNTNIGLVILSVLIPIAGVILYFVKKDQEPQAAKNYLIAGVISFVITFVINFASGLLLASL